MNLIDSTKKIRHKIVRMIAPVLYRSSLYGDEIAKMSNRPMIDYISLNLGDAPLIGVEIGVQSGINSVTMFNTLDIEHLYLIDPDLSGLWGRLEPYYDRITFIEKTSILGVDSVPNELDFVYIDGDHNYMGVRLDLLLYYRKVKKGGIFGGHDFPLSGVKRAVLEWNREHDYHLHNISADWWIVKR